VKVKAVGICGSDVHGYLGKTGRRTPPMIMGHEFSGVVERTGESVETVKTGDAVVVFPYTTCGHCSYCRKEAINQCPDKNFFGVFRANGAMAEYISARSDLLFPLPDGTDYIHGALVEPLSVALRAVNRADIQPESAVTIIGAGTIGLMCLILAKAQKPKCVVMVDIIESRLRLSRELGADLLFNSKDHDPASFISNELKGGTHVVIEAVGIEKTVQQAIQWVARGGKVVIVGLSQKMMSVDMHEIVNKEVRMEGSFLYDRREFQDILKQLPALKLSLDKIVSRTSPLAEGVELFKRLAGMKDNLLKVVLTD
ncbi:MAG TPA: alcohol dehydrogenase catalytic domain-containing protein, partial [Thermodesulfobacteriota bacterium]|nr:alcohol dehydrogenase catalytic domain-containing protein [Thermodesulfobacteriota bacterium]